MLDTKANGGQAFPGLICVGHTGQDEQPIYANPPGMTLRDYFAAKAMQSLSQSISGENWAGITAYQAYQLADAMLKARET